MYQVDKVVYVNSNKVIIYLIDRQFTVETTNGTALKLVKELLEPYFTQCGYKAEDTVVTAKVAA